MQVLQNKGGEIVFYDNFLRLCAKKNVTPSAVMRAIGLNKSSATYWKKGATPSSDTLQKLADYFNVSVDSLLGVYSPMEDVTVSGDPDDIEAIKEMFEKATQARRGQKTYGGLTYDEMCALQELNTRNRLDAAYARLNLWAHEKVADFAEKLTKNPKYLVDPQHPYRRPQQDAPESTPPAREGNVTIPPPPQTRHSGFRRTRNEPI